MASGMAETIKHACVGSEDMFRSGLSLRIFDVHGCGGFLITNYQAELPEFFEIGKDLVAYESENHLKELCAYYLLSDSLN